MKCIFCQGVVTEEDFCYGCESYVCIKCDSTGVDVADGHTSVEAHTGDDPDKYDVD